MGTGRTPGGPLSGGMEENQRDANKAIEQNKQKAQQTQPAQPTQQNQQVSTPADREAAAIQKNLEQNDRVAERNAAIREQAQKLAPKAVTPEQQRALELQKQNEQGR